MLLTQKLISVGYTDSEGMPLCFGVISGARGVGCSVVGVSVGARGLGCSGSKMIGVGFIGTVLSAGGLLTVSMSSAIAKTSTIGITIDRTEYAPWLLLLSLMLGKVQLVSIVLLEFFNFLTMGQSG